MDLWPDGSHTINFPARTIICVYATNHLDDFQNTYTLEQSADEG